MSDRDARKIRSWLVGRGVSQTRIAKDMGLTTGMISKFIAGKSQSSRVFKYFVEELGCPREFFAGRPEAKMSARVF